MPRNSKRAPRDAERAREAILEAALKRFSRCGYKGARIADVAKDAGYSEALVYHHFNTKAALFREVVSRIDAETRWFDDELTPDELVGHMREGELRYHLDARWRALDHVWGEALAGEADLLDLLKPQVRHAVDALDSLLGRFDQIEHPKRRQLVLLLLSVSYGSRVLRRYDPDAVTPEEAADLLAFCTRVVLNTLEGQGPAPPWRSAASVAGSSAASAPDSAGEPTKRGDGGLEPAGPPGPAAVGDPQTKG